MSLLPRQIQVYSSLGNFASNAEVSGQAASGSPQFFADSGNSDRHRATQHDIAKH